MKFVGLAGKKQPSIGNLRTVKNEKKRKGLKWLTFTDS